MAVFRGKNFNEKVWQQYQKEIPSTKKNTLVKSSIFTNTNEYEAKMKSQNGGYFIVEPIKGRIGGEPVNYDGKTNIPKGNERPTFVQKKICYGRANSWKENDFVAPLTGKNFKAEAGEVKEYWDTERQKTVLAILNGIFSMTGGVNGLFVNKHTYKVDGNLTADSCTKASQKALGDKRQDLTVMFMHSTPASNLESLKVLEYLKYTDKNGFERQLTIAEYNGRTVIEDDDMPTRNIYATTSDTEVMEGKTYYTRSGSSSTNYKYAPVSEPQSNPKTAGYYEVTGTEYVSYLMSAGFFEYEALSVPHPVSVVRDEFTNGGEETLISREREIIVPKLLSYKDETFKSPMNEDFANGKNWEIVNDGTGSIYVDDKLIPVVRIISRG